MMVGGMTEDERLSGEHGCHGALILPEVQQALDYAVKLLKNHGTCVMVSFPKEGFHIEPRDLVFRYIKMVGLLWEETDS
jgi:D-arabinose 1-dehydrogenase-like Zn-dependent alcohol dehydrogenase